LWDDELFTVKHAIELTDFWKSRVLAWLPHWIAFELAGVDVASLDPEQIWTWRAASITEWMRAPVAFLGALTILVLWFVGRRTLGVRPTLWLCLLLALSPRHLWMSQSAASRYGCSCSITLPCFGIPRRPRIGASCARVAPWRAWYSAFIPRRSH
jgi:hypothetical protein